MYNRGQDRSYTTDVNYIDENGRILHKNIDVGDHYINDVDDYHIISADNFFEDYDKFGNDSLNKAKALVKANSIYRKTKKGYKLIKKRYITFGPNCNTGDTSYIDVNHQIAAENETHIQYIVKSRYSEAYFNIIRKDEHKYTIA